MKRHWIRLMVLKIVVFASIAVFVFGEAIHYLWNWLMPSLFRLPAITFGQALGLMVLSWLLFGGLRGFRGSSHRGPWGYRMRHRWEQMTPEEREKFRQGMRARCGSFSPEAEAKAEAKP